MHKIIWVIVCMVIFFCSSCAKEESQPQETVNILTYYPKSEQPCIEPSQLIYHDRLKPEPLSRNQLNMLSTYVCKTKPNYVWFVRVLYNRRDTLKATIYFLPDYSSGRLRKGKFAYYDSFFGFILPKKYLDEQGFDPNEVPKPEFHEYTDVLPKYYSPSPGQIPYVDYLLPFSASDNLNDQEIIEIVDFVRTGPTLKKDDEWSINAYGKKANLEFPIMSITKESESIEVQTGTQEGPLAGSGRFLIIKKNDNGYELISIGMWVS